MGAYYCHDWSDPGSNEFIGHARTGAAAEALAVALGLPVSQTTDTCDASGSVTDDDGERVWLVLP